MFEKNGDVGGTWFENVYPGCRVDVPNQLYSFSFAQTNGWASRFSAQPDLLAYLQSTAKELGLGECIRFRSEVTEARFDDATRQWALTVRSADGTRDDRGRRRASSAPWASSTDRPFRPSAAGSASTARRSTRRPGTTRWSWPGRRVAVIGTGASAAQFVPCLVGEVGHLDVYQRTPPWLLPTDNYGDPFPPEFHDLLALLPDLRALGPAVAVLAHARGTAGGGPGRPRVGRLPEAVSAANDFVRSMLLDVLRAQVEDDALFEKMAPHFPPFAKRALRDDGRWAAALSRPDVELVTTPIAEITPDGVRTADGEDRPADVLIYGTGFSASDFVAPMRVFGSGGWSSTRNGAATPGPTSA